MSDVISRQAAINAMGRAEWAINRINELPSAQPEDICSECDAWNLYKNYAQPQRTGRWIDHVEDGYVECPFCHSATNCDDNISDLHFCFSCGARMDVE